MYSSQYAQFSAPPLPKKEMVVALFSPEVGSPVRTLTEEAASP